MKCQGRSWRFYGRGDPSRVTARTGWKNGKTPEPSRPSRTLSSPQFRILTGRMYGKRNNKETAERETKTRHRGRTDGARGEKVDASLPRSLQVLIPTGSSFGETPRTLSRIISVVPELVSVDFYLFRRRAQGSRFARRMNVLGGTVLSSLKSLRDTRDAQGILVQ